LVDDIPPDISRNDLLVVPRSDDTLTFKELEVTYEMSTELGVFLRIRDEDINWLDHAPVLPTNLGAHPIRSV
jgi:hypothetical protein